MPRGFELARNIRICNDREFGHESNCSASRGLPSDAEQLSRVTEFSIRTEQPLEIIFYCTLVLQQLHLGLDLCYLINFALT